MAELMSGDRPLHTQVAEDGNGTLGGQFSCFYIFYYICLVWGLSIWGMCHSMHMEDSGQLEGVGSLSPSRGHWE